MMQTIRDTAKTDTLLFVKLNVNKDKTMHVGDRLFLQAVNSWISTSRLTRSMELSSISRSASRALMPEGISHQLIRDL